MADTAIEVVLEMPFLTFTKVEVNFAERELNWKTYHLNEALLITNRVQIIKCKKFAAAILASDKKAFIVHVAYLEAKMSIDPAQKA